MAARKKTSAKKKTTSKKGKGARSAKSKGSNTGDSWYKTGADGFDRKAQLDAVAKLRKEKSVPRFFLKEDEEAKIVFVDSGGLIDSPCMM